MGCRKAPVVMAEPPPPLHADLICPEGTQEAGTPPPSGTEVWCHRLDASGTWLRSGPSISWHPNQHRSAQGEWKDNQRSGPWIYWHPNGAPQSHGHFSNGLKDGVWLDYHASGDPESEGAFVEGREHGPWLYWAADLTRVEGQWELGSRAGIWLDYEASGRASRQRDYRDGRLISQKEL